MKKTFAICFLWFSVVCIAQKDKVYTLSSLATANKDSVFKIDLSKREKHSALIDTELLCLVYLELTCGSQGGFSFAKNVNETKQETTEFIRQKYNLPIRNFSPTQQQLTLHQEFILTNFNKHYKSYI